jgi:16S rRNA A1518/A1519 N6-dimethyltransferase RsmA/KsgA/DIM1 with predicted DNA glycosylase/AP lyase activity
MPLQRDIHNPFFARLHHHVLQRKSTRKDIGCRREMLADLRGTVIEVGPGNGPNFELYPASVERVIAVEPEPYLREKAAQSARRAPVRIDLVAGDAEHLPAEDGTGRSASGS